MNGNSRKDGGKQLQIGSCVTSSIKSLISGGNKFPIRTVVFIFNKFRDDSMYLYVV